MNARSLDLRKRLLEAHQRGEGSPRQLAQRFSVGHATVERLPARFRDEGTIEPKQYRHGVISGELRPVAYNGQVQRPEAGR